MKLSFEVLFEFFLYLFLFLLFSSINSAGPELIQFRLVLGILLIAAAPFLFRRSLLPGWRPWFLLISVFFFLLLQAAKAAVGIFHLTVPMAESRKVSEVLYASYAWGPLEWFVLIGMFFVMAGFFCRKDRAERLLKTLVLSATFLAAAALPPLLHDGYGYGNYNGKDFTFFPSFFYAHGWLAKYLFGRWASMNWAGDYMAFGVFAAAGLGFYDLYRILEKKEPGNPGRPFFWLMLSMINAAALFLLRSRGSMLFFILVFIPYVAAVLIKLPLSHKKVWASGFIAAFLVFVFWAGNIPAAVKEMQTLSDETSRISRRSYNVNLDGQQRARRMFEAYKLFGVGRGNYIKASQTFAGEGIEADSVASANFTCMSHYWTVLAEEGMSGIPYFLWIFFLCLWALKQSGSASSRFQCIAGISLLAPMLMVLGHASINDLMDRFGMQALVLLSAGALWGIFRKDFGHFVPR